MLRAGCGGFGVLGDGGDEGEDEEDDGDDDGEDDVPRQRDAVANAAPKRPLQLLPQRD